MNSSQNNYNKNGQNRSCPSINENISNNKPNNFNLKPNSIYNMPNNNYINRDINKNKNYSNEEHIIIECICNNYNFNSKKDIIQCILCHKYQHLSCIFQAQYTTPYLCFNCQFKNNHFYLKWKKTILPAREIIYKKQWEDNKELLKEGTRKFEFYLNIPELNAIYNSDNNNSHYLAFLCLTNNGKPFHLGFPDNINIQINGKQFYFTENKGFKRPLLLALDSTPCYRNKRRHLITSDKYDIQNINDFFNTPRNSFQNNNTNKYLQKVIISFMGALETYVGSEFEFVEVRHYIIYIGLFQEIKIPQLNILRNCNDLKQCNDMFKNLYNEKVLKLKWNQVSNNITLGNDELNMNLVSNISNQKIIHPVRGLFCQHADVLDYGECCGYITSNSQVYKCFKCNKPLNIMYIDDMSEKIFYKYRNENFSHIYYTNDFKFIRGEKINETKEKNQDNSIKKPVDDTDKEEDDESFSDSFFNYYTKKEDNDTTNENNEINGNNENNNLINNKENEAILILDSSSESIEYNNNNDNNNDSNNKENPFDSNNNEYINNSSNNNINLREDEENSNASNNSNNILKDNQKSINENVNVNNGSEPQAINPSINEDIIILDDEDEEEEINHDKDKENINENFYENNYDFNNDSYVQKENESQQCSFESNNISENINKQSHMNKDIELNGHFMNKKINNNGGENLKKNQKEIDKQRQNIFGLYFPPKNKEMNKHKYLGEKRYLREDQDDEHNSKNKENDERELLVNYNSKKNREKSHNKLTKNNPDKSPFKRSKKKKEEKSKKIHKYDNITIVNNPHNSKEKNNNPLKLSEGKSIVIRDNNEPIINGNPKKRKYSEISSGSNSYNSNISNNKQNNTIKNKKKKKKEYIQKDKIHIIDNNTLYQDKEEEKINNDGDNGKKLKFMQIYEIDGNKNKEEEKNNKNEMKNKQDSDYESKFPNNKDMVIVRPYDELKKKRDKLINDDDENEIKFLNDFDIFENNMLNNRQNEFVNYDYYNIQRKLREFCSSRYEGDEIFNENKIFFNQFL